MSKYRVKEVLFELAEFSRELLEESSQILVYHRASANKLETSKKLETNVEQVRTLFSLMNDEFLLDLMADVDSLKSASGQQTGPGESILSLRVSHLVKHAGPALDQFQKRIGRDGRPLSEELMKGIASHRRSLLSVCKQGTRSWELLKAIS